MSTARKHSEKREDPACEKIRDVLSHLHELHHKVSRSETFTSPQKEVDKYAKKLIVILGEHHDSIGELDVHIKKALIDLTEIPYMHPPMLKIAFEVAIKAAMRNLQVFLDHAMMI